MGLSTRRKTIGVLISTLDRYYQHQLWHGIHDMAKMLDFNLLFFCGYPYLSPISDEKENNVIYDLANLKLLDGIICVTGTLSNYAPKDKFLKFISKFTKLPFVGLSIELPNLHSIVVDNYNSMRMVVEHLVETHNYKKFAFIAGPKTNIESEERTRAFMDVMTKNKVPKANQIIFEGNFIQESSFRGVTYFLDEKKYMPDVIICSNDEMAIGVYFALEERGIKVPTEVAFTGFDDIDNSISFSSAFTTIRQPFREMGTTSVTLLDNIMKNIIVPQKTSVLGKMIVRESCGCRKIIEELSEEERTKFDRLISYWETETINTYMGNHFEELALFLMDILHVDHSKHKYHDNIKRLIEDFDIDLKSGQVEGAFLRNFDYVLSNEVSNIDMPRWNEMLFYFKELISNHGKNNYFVAQQILFLTQVNTGNRLTRMVREDSYDFRTMNNSATILIQELNQVTNLDQLVRVIPKYLKHHEIQNYYICLFDQGIHLEEEDALIYPPTISMCLGVRQNVIIEPCRFNTKDMLPPIVLESEEREDFAFFPLFFRRDHFGYIISDTQGVEKLIFTTLKEQMSNTLERLMLYSKLESYNRQLEEASSRDVLTKLPNRRGFYEYATSAYQNAIKNLKPLLVIYGDLDGLKLINDVYGHQEGDEAIIQVSSILKESIKGIGMVARIGGDEFTCIVEELDNSDYFLGYQRRVEEGLLRYNKRSGKPYQLDISLGCAQLNLVAPEPFEQLLKMADYKLYKNKRKKKNI